MAIVKKIPVQLKNLKDQTNCYVIGERKKDVLIIDPGAECQKIINKINEIHSNPIKIILTHGHLDHWSAIYGIRQEWKDIQILIHEAEQDFYKKSLNELSRRLLGAILANANKVYIQKLQEIINELKLMKNIKPNEFLVEKEPIKVNNMELGILHTPGHSVGSVSLFTISEHDFEDLDFKRIIFTGDLVFINDVGINDFVINSGGDRYILWRSIISKIIRNENIPEDILIYPGHQQSMLKKCARKRVFLDVLQHPELYT